MLRWSTNKAVSGHHLVSNCLTQKLVNKHPITCNSDPVTKVAGNNSHVIPRYPRASIFSPSNLGCEVFLQAFAGVMMVGLKLLSSVARLQYAAMVKWKAIPTALENARKAWNLDQPLDPVFRTARPSALPHLGLGAMFNFRVNACPWLREALTAGKCMLGKPSSHMFSH